MILVNRNILLFVVVVVIMSGLTAAISISPPSYKYDFVPNQETTFSFTVDRANKIDVMLEFDGNPNLTKYVKLIDTSPNSSARQISVVVTLPEKMERPGDNKIFVKAKEVADNPGGIVALVAIRAPILIRVPYPGYYFTLQFSVPRVNQGETVDFKLDVQNLGLNDAKTSYVVIDVYDGTTKIKSVATETKQIPSSTTGEFHAYLSTKDIKAGSYRAIATFNYEEGTQTAEGTMNVGSLFVDIRNLTSELVQGKINRVGVEIESRWNNRIENVYSTIVIDGVEARTPSDVLNPWETKTQSGFIDTGNMAFGLHDMNLTVHYGDTSGEEKTTSRIVPISLVPPPVETSTVEKPSAISLKLTPIMVLVIIIALLVLFDLGWILINKLKSRKQPPIGNSGEKPIAGPGEKS